MNRKPLVAISGIAAALIFASLPSGQAAPSGKKASVRAQAAPVPTQYPVFTVRYVCFVAEPKVKLSRAEAWRRQVILPPVLDDLQNGSALAMDTTPEGFTNKLRGTQNDHKFQVILAGSFVCLNGSREAATVSDGPSPDAYQATLTESMFLKQNSPTSLTLYHTGQVAYSDGNFRGGPAWDNMHTDHIVLGRAYSQGVANLADGRRFVYAFCVLPGRLDQTASAWNKGMASKTANATGANRRVAR